MDNKTYETYDVGTSYAVSDNREVQTSLLSITNNSTGVISGSQYGVYLYYSSVSQITNSGIIQNTYLFKTGYYGGIQLSVENTVSPRTVTVGTITNNSGATISGAYGIYNGQVGTINQLVNSGNIEAKCTATEPP